MLLPADLERYEYRIQDDPPTGQRQDDLRITDLAKLLEHTNI